MITRRRFVRLVGGAAALVALPSCGDNLVPDRAGRFFDAHQWATIDVATGFIVPSDPDGVGAREALAVAYIDQLLAAFDAIPPQIFAGGPFSGRGGGAPSFAEFVPLSRVKAIAWRMRLFGSAATTGGDFNDAVLGATTGWRDLYAAGVAMLDAVAAQLAPGATFRALAPADQSRALDTVGSNAPDFYDALVEHTLEGTFGAPEYGGNANLVGWTKLARYDGDSAPLGHATYDAASDAMIDRADAPTSSGDGTTETFDDDVVNLLTVAAIGSGGMRFF